MQEHEEILNVLKYAIKVNVKITLRLTNRNNPLEIRIVTGNVELLAEDCIGINGEEYSFDEWKITHGKLG